MSVDVTERPSKRCRSDHDGWITPEAQSRRFLSIAERVSAASKALIPGIAKIISEYVIEEAIYWKRALLSIDALPEKIPPLPDDILETLDSICPIFGHEIDPEEREPYRVKKTHILALVTEDFKVITHFERHIIKQYLNTKSPKKKLFAKLAYKYLNLITNQPFTPFKPAHWILSPIQALPESENKSWEDQVELVEKLKQESGKPYQVATLHQVYTAKLTKKMAQKAFIFPSKKRSRDSDLRMSNKDENGVHLSIKDSQRFSGVADVHRSSTNDSDPKASIAIVWELSTPTGKD